MAYVEYKGETFICSIRNGKIRLRSKQKREGFVELVDLGGNIHSDIFIKEVDESDVSFAYDLDYEATYLGKRYSVNSVGKFLLQEPIMLFSNDIEDMQKNGFTRMDKFIFKKEVPIQKLDALIEYKIPLLRFSHMDKEITNIETSDINQYLVQLIE